MDFVCSIYVLPFCSLNFWAKWRFVLKKKGVFDFENC